MVSTQTQSQSWLSLCVLSLAALAAADILPSNSSTNTDSPQLSLQNANNAKITELVPLTREASMRNLEGNLFNTNISTVGNISDSEIAYISCNPSDYNGFMSAQSVFEQAYENKNISAAILYSVATDFCDYQHPEQQSQVQSFPIYSMTNKGDSQQLLNNLQNLDVSQKFFINVVQDRRAANGSPNQQQSNPLGPSPSTAVAMIILYSITGIITALFLVIIITGAIRAHRHPDRYGPRDVLGRPRQSRARGLGRAILDTIPIVKFGEREPAKPTDVELGSTTEARDANANANANANTTTGTEGQTNQTEARTETGTETPTRDANATETPKDTTTADQDQPSGIAGAAVTTQTPESEEHLGCSICTEDFEKGQDIRVLPCDHKFHPECVDPWLLNVSSTCPLCRVDLRPVDARDSIDEQDADTLAVPTQDEVSHRRRTAFRDILSLRSRPNASPEERISALRRLREQRRNQSGDVASGSANGSTDDIANQRRSRRVSTLFSDVFGSKSRRAGRDDSPSGGESSSNGAQPPRRDESPAPAPGSGSATPPAAPNSDGNQRS